MILIPALSEDNAAVIPVEPETAFIASLIAVKSVVDVMVAVIWDVVVLLPCNVKLKVAAALTVRFALLNDVALTPVSPDSKLKEDATSLASAPASTMALKVPKEPLIV